MREWNIPWYFKGKEDDAWDEFMSFVENKRRTENSTHPVTSCSQMCKERDAKRIPIGNCLVVAFFKMVA